MPVGLHPRMHENTGMRSRQNRSRQDLLQQLQGVLASDLAVD